MMFYPTRERQDIPAVSFRRPASADNDRSAVRQTLWKGTCELTTSASCGGSPETHDGRPATALEG
jgi:hypothetical protein